MFGLISKRTIKHTLRMEIDNCEAQIAHLRTIRTTASNTADITNKINTCDTVSDVLKRIYNEL